MKLLYAEDELQLSMAVSEILKIKQYEVDSVFDRTAAWEKLQTNTYDAVILDIMMPGLSGIEVTQKMRENNIDTPVILLTAKNETEDRITGLTSGADDYLGKPFAMGELLARIAVLIRRTAKPLKPSILQTGNISLNCETYELKSDCGSLRLSNKESELLALFLQSDEKLITSKEILSKLWEDQTDENAVDLYISYLRNKLKQIHSNYNIQNEENGFSLQAE